MATKKKAKRPVKKKTAKPKAKKKASATRARQVKTTTKSTPRSSTAHAYSAGRDDSLPPQLWRRSHYKTLKEFWPFYLHEHSFGLNRVLHFIGSTLGLVIAAIAIGTRKYWLLIPAMVCGYAFAWVGHFFIEKNRPATFKYPLKSFISDWRMWYCILSAQIGKEMKRYGISSK